MSFDYDLFVIGAAPRSSSEAVAPKIVLPASDR